MASHRTKVRLKVATFLPDCNKAKKEGYVFRRNVCMNAVACLGFICTASPPIKGAVTMLYHFRFILYSFPHHRGGRVLGAFFYVVSPVGLIHIKFNFDNRMCNEKKNAMSRIGNIYIYYM